MVVIIIIIYFFIVDILSKEELLFICNCDLYTWVKGNDKCKRKIKKKFPLKKVSFECDF